MIKKIVLAYSGGLDTSVAIKWLKEKYNTEIIAFCADLGQGEDLKAIKEKALKTGASKVYVEDLKEEFVKDYIFPMLRANAVYEGSYLLGTSIARPLIAKKQVEIAEKEGAEAVAHGATGKGNDQVRFELTYYALKPDVKVIAPWREWSFNSRKSLIEYSQKHGIPVAATKEKPYSIDRNLFHISYEGGILEDPWQEPPSDMYTMIAPPEKAPDKPEYIEISYKKGDPVAINNKRMLPAKLLGRLNSIAGKNGIGRIDIVENRYVGIKSRGVYETPGGTVLHSAHRAIESIILDREIMHLRDSLITRYSELIYYGYWFSPERVALQNLIDDIQKNVTGTVRVKLYKGNCYIVGRKSPDSLYHPELATFETEDVYNQKDAEGFIKINALRLKLRKMG
ncbi:MAG: argininosuccinate synthase [Nitrospirae bacterium CG_4_10_14_0_8_um_filter_41_23]|nr:argininosuccinate synthase [Nitrospirota bacterium]OIP60929.1 MAG: argininosuccinate synthase [Nitrospirae bacterium CG2_30_41_42]PIQ93104.1 MAG: argininosuccinate synthase [Nitrospirae bacterium CG11_big_fil_rev_8_21_14_0_20_41_14]PIV42005.1 MAG: argininosuccinate synthase [Nitrospirae bacterium CG02_land_8_20_14_3_00_41_53]PIW86866.1 MAG: argininosuccinate synthase [Nitrospirae bacterium CG_4_8_14_3_um_filter_41_47]PIY87406.1 MAG: argininosuccinate synthase [Nitrospirae bacterium CG_4_10_